MRSVEPKIELALKPSTPAFVIASELASKPRFVAVTASVAASATARIRIAKVVEQELIRILQTHQVRMKIGKS